ncbi:MAG TPA: group 1 truncated hemoglobin [Planctomycetaceae bacterium]|nr:group 1 truncated hemoglobin [Planctomycetaceae bacterium]
MTDTLYTRLGGYDGIVAVADNLLPRLVGDEDLGRFWAHRGDDGIARERQLLIDFVAHVTGGPMYYTGRDMKTAHAGMKISASDWERFLGHLQAALAAVEVGPDETSDVLALIGTTRAEIVEIEAN